MSVTGMTKRPAPQKMKFKLAGGDAACSTVSENGIMNGQKEQAKVPKAAMKISAENRNGAESFRRFALLSKQTADIAPIRGKIRRYGRSNQRLIKLRCIASASTKAVARKERTPTVSTGSNW